VDVIAVKGVVLVAVLLAVVGCVEAPVEDDGGGKTVSTVSGLSFTWQGVTLRWLGHAGFQVEDEGLVIYLDPYLLPEKPEKADIILVTHGHFDHCDVEKINLLLKNDTTIVAPPSCASKLGGDVVEVKPGDSLNVRGVPVEAVDAYNVDKFASPGKPYHPRGEGVGYILTLGGVRVYHAGDTDAIPEMEGLKVDIALLPIGGTYTMDESEAASAVAVLQPKFVVPMHYNTLDQTRADPQVFKRLVEEKAPGVQVKILQQAI